jgi:hypothetical protein
MPHMQTNVESSDAVEYMYNVHGVVGYTLQPSHMQTLDQLMMPLTSRHTVDWRPLDEQ